MAKMTKRKALFILFIISILLCACAGAKPAETAGAKTAPGDTAELVMSSLKTLDLDTFNHYTDNYICTHRNRIGIPTSREYRIFNELLQPALVKGRHYKRNYQLSQKILQNLTWEITDVRETGQTAEIDISITNIDMSVVTGNYIISLLENMSQSKGLGIGSLVKDMLDLSRDMDGFLTIIDSLDSDDTCTIKVTLSAFEENGKWKLHVSDEFINAFMGDNIDSEEYPEEITRKIEELEREVENNAEKWAEDFEIRADRWAESFEERMEGIFD